MGFSVDELSQITIGQALDYMAEYVKNKSDKKSENTTTITRQASQADFNSF